VSFVVAPLLVVPVPVLAVLVLPVLLAAPLSEDAFEPHPALIMLIRATIARAASGRSLLLLTFSPRVW
jgi:hypothetical protein